MTNEQYVIVPKAWPRMPSPPADQIVLTTPEQVRAFFENELQIWHFIHNHAPPVPHRAEVRSGIDHLSTFSRLIEMANELIADPESEEAAGNLRGTIYDRFGPEPAWPNFTSHDDVGKLILTIKNTHGPDAAAFAIEYVYKDTDLVHTPDLTCLSALTVLGDPAMALPAEASAKLQSCAVEVGQTIKKCNDTLESISRMKDVYAAEMQSRAAVEYWTDKTNYHNAKRRNLFIAIALYFGVFIISMVVFYSNFYGTFQEKGATLPTILYGILFAGGASVIAALVWIGRFIIKLYISEHQLREDASERVVMTKTYLALVDQAAIKNDSDRHVILTALFRPSPALITDEGPPEFGIGATIGKLVSSK